MVKGKTQEMECASERERWGEGRGKDLEYIGGRKKVRKGQGEGRDN